MARLIKTVEGQLVQCRIDTLFADGSSTSKLIKVDLIVEGMRYVENGQIKTVSGRVCAIHTTCPKVTPTSVINPQNNFSKDVIVTSLEIDASQPHYSKIVTVPAREIIEDEGLTDVVRVTVSAVPRVLLEMSYTDGTVVQQDVIIGDSLYDVVVMTQPGKPDIHGDFSVSAFLYNSVNDQVNISGMYLTPISGGDTICAEFSKIIRFEETSLINLYATTSCSCD